MAGPRKTESDSGLGSGISRVEANSMPLDRDGSG